MLRVLRSSLFHSALCVLIVAPLSAAPAQRVAPSGVHQLTNVPPSLVAGADTGEGRARTRSESATRGAAIGVGVGAVAGASVFAGLYVVASMQSGAMPVVDRGFILFALASLTGIGAVTGAIVGAATGALTAH